MPAPPAARATVPIRPAVCLLAWLAALAACAGGGAETGEPAAAGVSPPSAVGTADADPHSNVPPAAPPPPPTLHLGAPLIEATLAGGEVHPYRVALAAGDYLELAAVQRGVDLVLTLSAPDGRPLLTVDSPTGGRGEERLTAVAREAGDHRLEVRAWGTAGEAGEPTGGTYDLRVVTLGPAGADDRRRAESDRLLAAADELRRGGGTGSYREVANRYRRALRLAEALGDSLRQAHLHRRLGWLHRKYLDEKRASLVHYQRAVALYEESGETWLQASTTTLLGRVHRELGELEESLAATRRAVELWRRVGDPREEAAALHNLALPYLTHGRVEDAHAFFDRAVARVRELEDPAKEVRMLHNRGNFYRSLGKPRRALDDLRRSLELARRLDDRPGQARALAAIGRVEVELGRPADAEGALEEALALHRGPGSERWRARTLHLLAAARTALGQRRRARADLWRALGTFQELESPRDEAAARVDLASLAVAAHRPEEAAADLHRALELYRRLDDPAGKASALLTLARAERALGRLEAARHHAAEGLGHIEELRGAAAGPGLRAAFLARHQEHYELLLDLLMELHRRDPGAGHDREALAVSERSRARSLLDLLAAAPPAGAADADLRRRERELARRVAALEIERWEGAAGAPDAALDETRDQTLRDLLVTHDRVRGQRLRQRHLPRPLSAGEIQEQLLAADTLLLEYDLGTPHSYLWTVTRDGVRSHRLPPREEIEGLVRRAHGLLAESHRREVQGPGETALARLTEVLLAPVAPELEERRLLVVGDGALHYLPFAALPSPAGTAAAGEPLAAHHDVVALPSASALAGLRRRRTAGRRAPGSARPTVAVLADPVFTADDPRLGGEPAATGGTARGGDLARLVYSRREADVLRSLLPPADRLLATGFAARRDLVTGGALRPYRVLHFATHGALDDEHPELSRLVLSRFAADGSRRDGVLFAHQVSGLDLAADLVVLSACSTAVGREVRGEGLVGLTQAFFDAGADRVLVSLWPVDDEATAELMSRFYRALLAERRDPAAALHSAQLAVRRQPRWRAPYYWAGFVLQGEWRPPAWEAARPGAGPGAGSRTALNNRAGHAIPVERAQGPASPDPSTQRRKEPTP